MKEIGVAILGFGTVGAGVADVLLRRSDRLAARAGVRPVLRGIADVDVKTDRGIAVPPELLTTDAAALIARPDVQIVVELIGGRTVAAQFIRQALDAGKSVVTANKALLAHDGAELFRRAAAHGAEIAFEAAVAGGIPIIKALREGLIANDTDRIYGILNGTCNYILTEMTERKLPFADALADAQRKGYAEADPTLDVDGHDTAHKAAVLATLACGAPVPLATVAVEGIRGLSPLDIACAAELHCRIKLLAVIRRGDEGVSVEVRPTLIPETHLLAGVGGVYNAVWAHSDVAGATFYHGRGAGRFPTASAVTADIADVARRLAQGGAPRPAAYTGDAAAVRVCPAGRLSARHYLRLTLLDRPGALARVAEALGRNDISIATVVQQECSPGAPVAVILLTHAAQNCRLEKALAEIARLDVVAAPTVRLCMEDFQQPTPNT